MLKRCSVCAREPRRPSASCHRLHRRTSTCPISPWTRADPNIWISNSPGWIFLLIVRDIFCFKSWKSYMKNRNFWIGLFLVILLTTISFLSKARLSFLGPNSSRLLGTWSRRPSNRAERRCTTPRLSLPRSEKCFSWEAWPECPKSRLLCKRSFCFQIFSMLLTGLIVFLQIY